MGLRCVFESVMNPYYLWPPLALALLAASLSSWPRFAVVVAMAAGETMYSYRHTGPWSWWLPTVTMLAIAILFSRPAAKIAPPRDSEIALEVAFGPGLDTRLLSVGRGAE